MIQTPMKNIALCWLALSISAFAQTEIPLWNGDMPGQATSEPEVADLSPKDHVTRVSNVSNPTITHFPAEPTGTPHPLVVVCPGGGYNRLSIDKEGTEVAQWLNTIGVSAAVLKYRVPKNRDGALADARRAMQIVRGKQEEWNIDGQCIGMLGFSAGGHLAAACSTTPDRPDFTVLVYPAYLFQDGSIEIAEDIAVDAETPPAFVVQTRDDKRHYRSSLAYVAALDAANVPAELHLFAKGGHGYGLRPSDHPVSRWPKLCEDWMRASGFLKDGS